MKKILLGCPYTGLHDVQLALEEISCKAEVILTKDIDSINGSEFFINSMNFKIEEVGVSFIRYPYDLIPPHTKNYFLREETEYYKSIGLIFDTSAINCLASTWQLRNRAFSLLKAKEFGCKIPEFSVQKKLAKFNEQHNLVAVKAIGNCFVSENMCELTTEQKTFLSIEEDDGEYAAVFPASKFNSKKLSEYLSLFGHAFSQKIVNSELELRCYLVNNILFVYQRDNIDRFDKSFADYKEASYKISIETQSAIKNMARYFNLEYLCFDIIIDMKIEYIIDINPYGSFPTYDEHPEVSIEIAKLLNSRIING